MMSAALIRTTAFLGLFVLMALWEVLAPEHIQQIRRRQRWPANLALLVLNAALLRLIPSGAALGTAQWAASHQQGWLHQWAGPSALKIALALAGLDVLLYWQHRLLHRVPWLWRLHRVHHADLELDVSSAGRFHPLEALLSMGLKMAAVILLGAPPEAVLAFELSLNLCATFHHSNIHLPLWLESRLRLFLMTPELHRIHHSAHLSGSDRNFGFSGPWWDRLFGSWSDQIPQPLTFGDGQLRDPVQTQPLGALLRMPFYRDLG